MSKTGLERKIMEYVYYKPMNEKQIITKIMASKERRGMYTDDGVRSAIKHLIDLNEITESNNKYYPKDA